MFIFFQLSEDVEKFIEKLIDECILNEDTSDSHYNKFCYEFVKEEFPELSVSNFYNYFYECVDECKKLHDIYADD